MLAVGLNAWRRHIAWQMRSMLRWSPPVRRKCVPRDPATLLQTMTREQHARYGQLGVRYDLRSLPVCCTRAEYVENLYVLDVLDRYLSDPRGERGLEIGCRNFSYLPALHSYVPMAWDGVELDAYARYWNGRTRRAYGDHMAAHFESCRYLPASLLDIDGHYDLIVWFLPFVVLDPLLRWGLPQRFFEPARLLEKAANLLVPAGRLFIVNQGLHEADQQQRLCERAGLSYQALGPVASVFSPFRKTRFGFLVQATSQQSKAPSVHNAISVSDRVPGTH